MYSVKELERFMEQRRWPSGRDFGGHARHCVGYRSLLCRHHGCELEIPLYPPYRFFNRDYSVFDCGGMAFSEANLKLGGSSAIGKLRAVASAGGNQARPTWQLDRIHVKSRVCQSRRLG